MKSALNDCEVRIAVMRANNDARTIGFDWPYHEDSIMKLIEECFELKRAWQNGTNLEIDDELGDVLFMAYRVAICLGRHPTRMIEGALEKFDRRLSAMWGKCQRVGKHDYESMCAYWQEVKVEEK